MNSARRFFAPVDVVSGRVMGAVLWGILALSLTSTPCGAAEIRYGWDDGEVGNWVCESKAAKAANSGGYLSVMFKKQYLPLCENSIIRTSLEGIVVTNISFRVKSMNRTPSSLKVSFHSNESGKTWSLVKPASNTTDWALVTAEMLYTKGWSCGPDGSEEDFRRDLLAIDWVGLQIRRHGDVEAQAYGIDDFIIRGIADEGFVPGDPDKDDDGLPDDWEKSHGLSDMNGADALQDSDGDGHSNMAEYIAGTDPGDRKSNFSLDMGLRNPEDSQLQTRSEGLSGSSGFVLRWQSIEDRTYSVLRTSNLMDGFATVAEGIPATPPVNEFEDLTAEGAEAFFYRVVVNEAGQDD